MPEHGRNAIVQGVAEQPGHQRARARQTRQPGVLQRPSRHLLIEGDPEKNSGVGRRGIGIPRGAVPHRVGHCFSKIVWQHGCSFCDSECLTEAASILHGSSQLSPLAELLQSNSCPRACSHFRIIPNRDSPGLQSISISRFPPDVDRRLHLQHRHVDADRWRRAGWSCKLSNSAFLLGLDAFLGGIPIFLFSLVGGVVADRIERRKVLLDLAVRADGLRLPAHRPDRLPSGARLADPLPVVRRGLGAGLRRPGLPGADSDAGQQRGHAERHRAEIHPVQRGARDRPGAGRHRADAAGRDVVLRAERRLVLCADHFAADAQGALLSAEDHANRCWPA